VTHRDQLRCGTGPDWPRPYASHAEFYSAVYGHTLRDSRSAGCRGAVMMLAEQAAGDFPDAPTPDLVVSALIHRPLCSLVDLGAGRFRDRHFAAGDMLVVPPGVHTRFTADQPHTIRIIAIPYGGLRELGGPGLPADGDFGHLHTRAQRDRELSELLNRMWLEPERDAAHAALWFDGTLLQLAASLLRLRDGAAPPAVGGLAPWQERRVMDHMRAHLAEKLTLGMLAELSGLSPFHFARAFKRSTGQPPHACLRALRTERARLLLETTTSSIVEIALEVGYDSSQALARAFRREVGVSPTTYRRERRR